MQNEANLSLQHSSAGWLASTNGHQALFVLFLMERVCSGEKKFIHGKLD